MKTKGLKAISSYFLSTLPTIDTSTDVLRKEQKRGTFRRTFLLAPFKKCA